MSASLTTTTGKTRKREEPHHVGKRGHKPLRMQFADRPSLSKSNGQQGFRASAACQTLLTTMAAAIDGNRALTREPCTRTHPMISANKSVIQAEARLTPGLSGPRCKYPDLGRQGAHGQSWFVRHCGPIEGNRSGMSTAQAPPSARWFGSQTD